MVELFGTEKGSLDFIQIVPLVLFNQLAVVGGVLRGMEWMGLELVEVADDAMSVDWFFENVCRFVGMVLVMNFWFYVLHFLAHKWTWMYKNVHSVHHQLVMPVGYGAIYCHPVEHLVVNLGPVMIAVWQLSGWDWWLVHCFVAFVSLETVLGHTVYKIGEGGKESDKGSRHYFHHFERGCNYGNSRYWEDKFFGTFRDWENWNEGSDSSSSDGELFVRGRAVRRRRSGRRKASPSPEYPYGDYKDSGYVSGEDIIYGSVIASTGAGVETDIVSSENELSERRSDLGLKM